MKGWTKNKRNQTHMRILNRLGEDGNGLIGILKAGALLGRKVCTHLQSVICLSKQLQQKVKMFAAWYKNHNILLSLTDFPNCTEGNCYIPHPI